MSEPRRMAVRRNILKQNDGIARGLREQFPDAGVFVVSLVSSPGSGKTTFLEKTLTLLQPRWSRRRFSRRSGNRERRCASRPQQGSSQADYNGNTVPPGSGDGAERATGLGSAST